MDTYFKQENEDELCVKLPGVPEEMWADGVDPKESWKKWKLGFTCQYSGNKLVPFFRRALLTGSRVFKRINTMQVSNL